MHPNFKTFFLVFEIVFIDWSLKKKIFQDFWNFENTNFKTLDTLPRETNDTNFPNLLIYASKKVMSLGKEYGIKCGL